MLLFCEGNSKESLVYSTQGNVNISLLQDKYFTAKVNYGFKAHQA